MLQGNLLIAGDPEVDRSAPVERIELDDRSWVDVVRGFLRGADELVGLLAGTIEWRQGRRWMYDREVDDPRLSRWFTRAEPDPHVVLRQARLVLEARYRIRLGGVGLNYYRDGHDSVAFHRDRELRQLDRTVVAIVTLGAQRPFLLRPLGGGPSVNVAPASGDLLVMGGRCQAGWEHGVPKVSRATGPRISASWRWSSRQGRHEVGGGTYFSSRRWRSVGGD